MNIVLLMGRLVQDLEMIEHPNGYYARITLAVRREFKNSDGVYDTDFLPITLWEGAATACSEYCKKGTLVQIKCRLQYNRWEDSENKTHYDVEILGEKITLVK